MNASRVWSGRLRAVMARRKALPRVFISYRRDDSLIHARLLHNELAARFGAERVFMDVDDIDYGEDFMRVIDAHLDSADVVVAVIGPRWTELLQRRLASDDYVRHELARALARAAPDGLRVIPVLVGGAGVPGEGLPDELAPLRTLNCLVFGDNAALLPQQVDALVAAIRARSVHDDLYDALERLRSGRRARYIGAGVGLAMFFAAWVALFDFVGLDTRLASATMLLGGFGAPVPWSGRVVLVSIDEASERSIGRPFDASWRREHARLIERLARAGARTAAFDLFVEQPADAQADATLEAAIGAAGDMAVVFGVQALEADRRTPRLLPRLAAVARWGVACAGHRLGYARSMPLAVAGADGRVLPSFALAARVGSGPGIDALDVRRREVRVQAAGDDRTRVLGFSHTETVRVEQPGCAAIRVGDRVAVQLLDPHAIAAFSQAEGGFPVVTYEAALAMSESEAAATFDERIVVVGPRLAGRDMVSVAAGAQATMHWGVELIAVQLDALVRGVAVRPLSATAEFMHMVAMGLGGAFARRSASAWPHYRRALLIVACLLAYAIGVSVVYRSEELLVAAPYGLAAFMGAWSAMARLLGRGAA
ncbi:MAG TPA: CHASE2 domain-containing protein [Rhodocyclaceae bacterium]|nr:CHASE2 domain-containing protein [Rhodocyclaceae bacterium]